LVYSYIKAINMARQSISLTKPNNEWLKRQIEKNEYTSKSGLINDLVRQARNQQSQVDLVRMKLENAEKSGFTSDDQEGILKTAKEGLNGQV